MVKTPLVAKIVNIEGVVGEKLCAETRGLVEKMCMSVGVLSLGCWKVMGHKVTASFEQTHKSPGFMSLFKRMTKVLKDAILALNSMSLFKWP